MTIISDNTDGDYDDDDADITMLNQDNAGVLSITVGKAYYITRKLSIFRSCTTIPSDFQNMQIRNNSG